MTDADRLDEIVTRLVSATDPDEVRHLYRQWAASYDDDLESFGYVAPPIGVARFARLVNDRKSRIHDAGCGTGLVGTLLHDLGYQYIDGSDFSTDMLGHAGKTGVYKALTVADYSRALEFSNNIYDGIISIGVYTRRFNDWFIPEMLRMLKPGGSMLFTCRELYYKEVALKLLDLHQQQKITTSTVSFDDYMTGQKASAYYVSIVKAR